jgi:hypothetical protein
MALLCEFDGLSDGGAVFLTVSPRFVINTHDDSSAS